MNISSLILVDSSVWIDFFRNDNHLLSRLIEENLACTNELILSELIPYLQKNNQKEVVEGLYALPLISLDIDWDSIRNYQLINLQNGINKVGIPDLIVLQQALEYKMQLFSLDKHFQLMSAHFNLNVFEQL